MSRARKPTHILNMRPAVFPGRPYTSDVFSTREWADKHVMLCKEPWVFARVLYRVNVYLKKRKRRAKS